MNYKRNVPTQCPYCQTKNDVVMYNADPAKEIVTCEVDNGGCDKDYVARIKFVPEVQVYKIAKIEEA